MKSILVIAVCLSVASLAVAQSDGQQTIADTYNLSYLGYSGGVSMALPGEAFTSVRLLGIGGGFKGVVADSCTDYMANPGEIPIGPLQLYTYIGRESGVETVYLGTFAGNHDQGLSVLLRVRNLSFSSNAFTSTSTAGTYGNSQNSNVGQRQSLAGADLRYNHSLPGGTMIGAGYQFRYTGSSSSGSDTRSNMSFPDSGFSLQGQETDFSNSGPENRFMLGASFPNRNGSLQVYGYATATSHHPNETESFRFAAQSSIDSDTQTVSYRTDLKGRSMFAGIVYEQSGKPDAITRYLIEAGYSTYDGSGGYRLSRSHYNATPAGFYLSTRSASGKIFNVRLAVATDRRIEDDMRVFAGANLLYSKNSFHTGELVAAGSTVPPVDEFGYMNGNSIGASVSIPLGFEYRLNDVLSLRGGAEEGYSYDNFTYGNNVYGQIGGQSTRFFSGSLWSVISAGSTYRVGSKVEVSMFISYDFLQVAGTALSIFYSL